MSIKTPAKKSTKSTFAPFEHSFSVEEEVSALSRMRLLFVFCFADNAFSCMEADHVG